MGPDRLASRILKDPAIQISWLRGQSGQSWPWPDAVSTARVVFRSGPTPQPPG